MLHQLQLLRSLRSISRINLPSLFAPNGAIAANASELVMNQFFLRPCPLSKLTFFNINTPRLANVHTLFPGPLADDFPSRSQFSRAKMWTSVEDARLRNAVRQHGQNWVRVAALVGNGRDNKACRQRWLRLSSFRKAGPFTATETSRVRRLLEQYPNQWTLIAKSLETGRTGEQVRDLILERLNPELSLKSWTAEEDELLRKAVSKHGVGHWVRIAEMVPGRSDASCFSRWNFSLAPDLVKGMWTEKEDMRLLQAVEKLRKHGELFHFGDVAHLMGGTRHRKACLARYERLAQQGKAPKLHKHRVGQGRACAFVSYGEEFTDSTCG